MNPDELLGKYKKILEDYRKKLISQEQFLSACRDLQAQDEKGTWWAVDSGTGGLLNYDNSSQSWKPAKLPLKTEIPKAIQKPKKETLIKSKKTRNGETVSYSREKRQEFNSIFEAFIVVTVNLFMSLILWTPLSYPSLKLNQLVKPGNCTTLKVGSPQMYLCSVKVAALTIAGPIIIFILMFLLRKQLSKFFQWIAKKLPKKTNFLSSSVFATFIFLIMWSGAHSQTADQVGLLPQKVFPVVIGLFTYVVGRFGPQIQESLNSFFEFRDKFPKPIRLAAVFLAPTIFAFLITAQKRVVHQTLKEQLTVIFAIMAAYLILTPRKGDFVAGVRKMFQKQGQN